MISSYDVAPAAQAEGSAELARDWQKLRQTENWEEPSSPCAGG